MSPRVVLPCLVLPCLAFALTLPRFELPCLELPYFASSATIGHVTHVQRSDTEAGNEGTVYLGFQTTIGLQPACPHMPFSVNGNATNEGVPVLSLDVALVYTPWPWHITR